MTAKEKSLLAGCISGHKASWDAFVNQYSPLVYHTIRKTLVTYHAELSSDLVDDLFQEFFLAIIRDDFKKLRQFKGERGCTLATWLRLVAARLTIDLLRKKRSVNMEITRESSRDDDPVATVTTRQEEEALVKAIETLSSRDRVFVDLCFFRELPVDDIAAFLKISVNAVYTQKSRILQKLRLNLTKVPAL